ncbi:MAG: NAD-dependent epimerase/dehydratase family protein [Paludibacter sp.]
MILVTGGTGLVGGHLLWHLLQENDRICAIKRTSSNLNPLKTIFAFYSSKPDEFLARIDWIIADVLDIDSMRLALVNITQVFHCAAVVSLGNSAEYLLDTNVTGTRNLVTIALEMKIEKLCFVSSIAACGKAEKKLEIDENCSWNENKLTSLYARSKYYSEQEVWKGISKGLNAVIVNPGVILGVSGTNSGSSQLFSQVKKGLMFYTNGGSGYVDVQDVVRIMIELMKSKISGERFILVSENCSNRDVLSWMADGFAMRRPFIPIGRKILWLVGVLSEFLGYIFRFSPLIDRGTARSATNRGYYSSRKIKNAIDWNFKPVKDCIMQICEFDRKIL